MTTTEHAAHSDARAGRMSTDPGDLAGELNQCHQVIVALRAALLLAEEQRDDIMRVSWPLAAAIEALEVDPYCPRARQPMPTADDPGPMPVCLCGVHTALEYVKRYKEVRALILKGD